MRLNQLTIIGRLGADARLQDIVDKTVCHFDVAVSAYKRGDKPQWFRCNLWGERGRKLVPYLKKGQAVCVQGEVSISEFVGRDGLMRATADVRVSDVVLLGGGKERDE